MKAQPVCFPLPSVRAASAIERRIEHIRQLHGDKAATWMAAQVLIAIDTILSEALETQIERRQVEALSTMPRRKVAA